MTLPIERLEEITIARHGETEWNREGRRQGCLDSPLTAEGLAAAHRFAAAVATWPIDVVFSSPLGRAMSTASIYAGALGVEITVVDELHEIDHGAMSGRTRPEIELAFPGALAVAERDRYEWRFPGGESYADADGRAARAVERMRTSGARRPLVVSHEMIGRMLLRNLLALDPDEALALSQPHGVVFRIDVATRRAERIELTGVGPPRDSGRGHSSIR